MTDAKRKEGPIPALTLYPVWYTNMLTLTDWTDSKSAFEMIRYVSPKINAWLDQVNVKENERAQKVVNLAYKMFESHGDLDKIIVEPGDCESFKEIMKAYKRLKGLYAIPRRKSDA